MCSSEMSEPTCVAGSIGSPMRIAETRAASLRRNSCLDRAMNEDPGSVRAHLARRIEVAEQRAGYRLVELRILEDD